jgi:hypothetical protein
MNTRMLTALAALLLAGCATTTAPRQATERFNQPSPEPVNEWIAARGMWQGKHPAVEFRHPASGDILLSTMLDTMEEFPATQYRRALDGELSAGCAAWTSQTLDETPAGRYPRQIWYSQCDGRGTSNAFLHLYIAGKSAGYYVFYRWNERPPAASVEKWAKYMRELFVCDDAPGSSSPCPAPEPGTAYERANPD